MIGPEQGEPHIPIQTLIQRSNKSSNLVQDPTIPDQRMQYLKLEVALGICSTPVPFHSIRVPDQVQYLAHAHPVSLVNQQESVIGSDPPDQVCDADSSDQIA